MQLWCAPSHCALHCLFCYVLIFILFCVLLAIVYSLGNQNLVVLLAWTMYSCVQHELTDAEGAPRIHGGTYMRKIAFVNIGNGV